MMNRKIKKKYKKRRQFNGKLKRDATAAVKWFKSF